MNEVIEDKHYCFINSKTNIVFCIATFRADVLPQENEGVYTVEVPEHDPHLFGKKYEGGAFVDPKTGGV